MQQRNMWYLYSICDEMWLFLQWHDARKKYVNEIYCSSYLYSICDEMWLFLQWHDATKKYEWNLLLLICIFYVWWYVIISAMTPCNKEEFNTYNRKKVNIHTNFWHWLNFYLPIYITIFFTLYLNIYPSNYLTIKLFIFLNYLSIE